MQHFRTKYHIKFCSNIDFNRLYWSQSFREHDITISTPRLTESMISKVFLSHNWLKAIRCSHVFWGYLSITTVLSLRVWPNLIPKLPQGIEFPQIWAGAGMKLFTLIEEWRHPVTKRFIPSTWYWILAFIFDDLNFELLSISGTSL